MGRVILFVDDERAILRSIEREFFDSDYEVFFAENANDALKILEENKVNMLVTDMKMPVVTGEKLLIDVKDKYPDLIKVILTGDSDKNVLYRCISNKLARYSFLKPWKEDELIKLIDRLFELYDFFKNKDIENLVNKSDVIPTVMAQFEKINSMIESDDVDFDKLIMLISEDQAVASKILKIVNSSFYNQKTKSLKSAVINLGRLNIKAIILAHEVYGVTADSKFVEIFWKHALTTNKIACAIYEEILRKKMPEEYYTAGLFHDIGKILFLMLKKDKYEEFLTLKNANPTLNLDVLEKSLFKCSHDLLGAYILNLWNLNYSAIESSLFHNNPKMCNDGNREIVSVIHLANYYSWGVVNKNFQNKLQEEVLVELGINKEELQKMITKIDLR